MAAIFIPLQGHTEKSGLYEALENLYREIRVLVRLCTVLIYF